MSTRTGLVLHASPQLTPLAFVRKRFFPITATFCVSMVLALVVIVSLPSIYQATATILVEGRTAHLDILRTSAGSLQEHLSSVRQTVLNRDTLNQIIQDFGLYPALRSKLSRDEMVDHMRKDIVFDISKASAETASPFGRLPMDTYLVKIEYSSRSPMNAASVAIVLLNHFMDESTRRRENKAQETYSFLFNQAAATKIEIEEVEQEIAKFKKENIKSLPELMNMNQMSMERIQKEMDSVQMELTLARERSLYLEGQLAIQEPLRHTVTTEGQKILSLEEQVRQMRSQLLAMRAVESDKHPDVVRLSRRLAALEEVLTTPERLRGTLARLKERQTNLAALRQRYSSIHPEVVALEKEVALLTREADQLAVRNSTSPDAAGESPDNPAYISLSTQLAQAKLEIEAKTALLGTLSAKYEDFRRRVMETPEVEQLFTNLQRRYETLKVSLQDITARMQSAREAADIEKRDLGEKMNVLESPVIPERPIKPDRGLLSMLGFIVSLGLGFLAGFVVESIDPTVHSPQEVANFTGLPLLGTVPSLETVQERTLRLKRRRAALVAGLGGLALAGLIWYLFTPLSSLCGMVREFIGKLF
jgi:uncharacterized protein involved in exopolysaccharide biosynthesis